jgi:catechol 2,3-dioxygenase-like lactoylglutathione lyase family enzyme
MIDHISIGASDLGTAGRFYDAVFAPLGVTRLSNGDGALGYGKDEAAFWVLAADGLRADDARPGVHFCFVAPSRAAVDAFHRAALAEGGRDNGAPGIRADYGPDYYAAFAVDPDGYRIEAYCGQPA